MGLHTQLLLYRSTDNQINETIKLSLWGLGNLGGLKEKRKAAGVGSKACWVRGGGGGKLSQSEVNKSFT